MGAFFSIAGTASINDVFFVHQRGFRVGLWNLAVISSVNLAPVVSSRIIVNLSWRWAFWILAISFGVLVVAVSLLMPESHFERQVHEGQVLEGEPIIVDEGTTEKGLRGESGPETETTTEDDQKVESISLGRLLHPCPAAISSSSSSQLFTALYQPLTLLKHPAAIWACCMWAVVFSWTIIQGAVASQIFGAPPFNMSATAVGNLIGVAPLIGSLLGTLVGGYVCDFAAVYLSRRNCDSGGAGIYEPEFRLWTIILVCIVPLAVGTFGLGSAIAEGLSPIVCGFFLACLNFAVGSGCTGIVAYSNDVFGDRAGEVFGLAMVVKSAFAFGLTFMLNDYYANHGPKVFFFTWGALSVGVALFGTNLMYVYGKQVRAWAGRQ
jgi:hypothetical protein